jgi:hypothetical protein
LVRYFDLKGTCDELTGYWKVYGGFRAIFRSIFGFISILLTILGWPIWICGGWIDPAFNILPSLMGLSIGAMAIILALPSTVLFKALSEKGRDDSYYMDISAKFVHFILIQVIALLFAIFSKFYDYKIIYLFGFLFFIYAILIAIPISLSLFGLSQMYNKFSHLKDDEYF